MVRIFLNVGTIIVPSIQVEERIKCAYKDSYTIQAGEDVVEE